MIEYYSFPKNRCCPINPAKGFLGMMIFARNKAVVSHDTWECWSQRLWEADRKSRKGKKCNKRQSATLHTSCQGLTQPSPSVTPSPTQNQPDLLVAGDFLDCSEVMDWCATAQGIALPSVCWSSDTLKKKKKKKKIKCTFLPKKLVILSLRAGNAKRGCRIQLFLLYCSKSTAL